MASGFTFYAPIGDPQFRDEDTGRDGRSPTISNGDGPEEHKPRNKKDKLPDEWENNSAVDLLVPCGTTVRAPFSGKVVRLGAQASGDKRIAIDDGKGHAAFLGHLQEIDTDLAQQFEAAGKKGINIAAGQILGVSGKDAKSGICHLHFGMGKSYRNRSTGNGIDPRPWLNSRSLPAWRVPKQINQLGLRKAGAGQAFGFLAVVVIVVLGFLIFQNVAVSGSQTWNLHLDSDNVDLTMSCDTSGSCTPTNSTVNLNMQLTGSSVTISGTGSCGGIASGSGTLDADYPHASSGSGSMVWGGNAECASVSQDWTATKE
jgi:Peptidase family M23